MGPHTVNPGLCLHLALEELHLLFWALFAALCAGATLADPLGLWGDPLGVGRATGFRSAEYQEDPFRQARLAQRQPELLVLGTSRSRAYLSTAPAFLRGYNAAIGGTHMEDLARMARFALAQPTPPKVLLLELHPWLFQGRPPRQPLWWDDLPSQVQTWWQLCGHHRAWALVHQRLAALQVPRPLAYAPDGQGVHLDVMTRPDHEAAQLVPQWKRYASHFLPGTSDAPFSPEAWAALAEVIDTCRRKGTQVQVLFPPGHVLERLGLEHRLGRLRLRHWKTRVVRMTGSAWDFGTLEGTQVALPVPTLNKHFLDPSHATALCGPWVWARLGLAGPLNAPPSWGQKLSPGQVPAWEARLHEVSDLWLRRHRAQLAQAGWKLQALASRP